MKITLGEWKTRDGRKAIVAADNGIAFHGSRFIGWIDRSVSWWDERGTATAFGGNTPFDLIAPWTEPVPWDWSTTPPWFDWIAMDADGEWTMFDTEPGIGGNTWLKHGFHTMYVPHEYWPKWSGDWKLSKTQRPKGVAK